MNTGAIAYMITYGFSAVVRYARWKKLFKFQILPSLLILCWPKFMANFCYFSTRVSNEIGAGNIQQAKNAVSVTLKLSVLLGLTVILLIAICHNLWASLFSSSQDIKTAFAYMTPLLATSILFDSVQGVLSGQFQLLTTCCILIYPNLSEKKIK